MCLTCSLSDSRWCLYTVFGLQTLNTTLLSSMKIKPLKNEATFRQLFYGNLVVPKNELISIHVLLVPIWHPCFMLNSNVAAPTYHAGKLKINKQSPFPLSNNLNPGGKFLPGIVGHLITRLTIPCQFPTLTLQKRKGEGLSRWQLELKKAVEDLKVYRTTFKLCASHLVSLPWNCIENILQGWIKDCSKYQSVPMVLEVN